MLAHYGTTTYDALVFLHVLFVVVAFAPTVMGPVLRLAGRGDDELLRRAHAALAPYTMRIHGGALVLAGLVGFGIQGLSDLPATGMTVYELGDAWLLWSIVAWVAMNGVLHALVVPGERALAAEGGAAGSRLRVGSALMTLLFVVTLWLMVVKPGA